MNHFDTTIGGGSVITAAERMRRDVGIRNGLAVAPIATSFVDPARDSRVQVLAVSA